MLHYVTSHLGKLNSAFHPSGVGKSSTDLWLRRWGSLVLCGR